VVAYAPAKAEPTFTFAVEKTKSSTKERHAPSPDTRIFAIVGSDDNGVAVEVTDGVIVEVGVTVLGAETTNEDDAVGDLEDVSVTGGVTESEDVCVAVEDALTDGDAVLDEEPDADAEADDVGVVVGR